MWSTDFCPGPVDIDIHVSFPQEEAWVPATVVVQADDLPIWGCGAQLTGTVRFDARRDNRVMAARRCRRRAELITHTDGGYTRM